MAKGSKKRIIDKLLKSEGELSSRIREEINEAASEDAPKYEQGGEEFDDLVIRTKQSQKQKDFIPRRIGRPRGKSTRTIQRENWIRDKFEHLKTKRVGGTLAEKASLIRSEMKEKTPPCFQRGIYEKSTIIKILKTKPWLDD